MLIMCQKFGLHMLGHCNSLCHVITCNMCKMWGLIYSHTMRTLPTSCHMVLHSRSMRTQASQPPACQELLMDEPFVQANQYLSEITASHFSTLNTKFANRNMLKRILIAMHNENKANCNENFRICAEEPVAPLYKC